MLKVLKRWYQFYFSDEQAAYLALTFIGALAFLYFLGSSSAYLLIGLILLYLLDELISWLEKFIPRMLAFIIISMVFISLLATFFLWLLPLFLTQFDNLTEIDFDKIPSLLDHISQEFFPSFLQGYISHESVESEIIGYLQSFLQKITGLVLRSLQSISNAVMSLTLVFVFVFLALSEKHVIQEWFKHHFVPGKSDKYMFVLSELWLGIGKYFRGKLIEAVIVLICTFIVFYFFDLNYKELLAFFVGCSVFIPYLGIFLATIPVVFVASQQFGLSDSFYILLVLHMIIQFFDGYVLVTFLFSKVSGISPALMALAIVVFSGLWGSWGMIIAIPLAISIKTIYLHWPVSHDSQSK